MSCRKPHLPPPVSYAKRPHAVRSAPLFPLDSATTPASSSSPRPSSASPDPSDASPTGRQSDCVASNFSIRPFDLRDSDDESDGSQPVLNGPVANGKVDVWSVQPSGDVKRTASDPGYSVSGYAVTGWTYVTKLPTQSPQPLTADERRLSKEVAVEDAMRELGLSYGHRMRTKLKRRTALQLQSAMRHETGEIDRTVLRLCETGQLSSRVGLYRIMDHNHSAADMQFTLVTKQPVKQYEPICAVIGTLREHHAYRKLVGGGRTVAMLWAVIVDQTEMPPHYTGPELLLDTAHYSNESRFLRDPTFAHRDVQPNVEARLVWNQKQQSINVVYVTLQAMPAGVELWKRWDRRSRELVWECQMKYAARRSHCQWHYIGLLQRLLRDNGLDTRPTQLLQRKRAEAEEQEQQVEGKECGGDKPLVEQAVAGIKLQRTDEQQQLVGEPTQQPSLASPSMPHDKRNEHIPFSWHESRSWTLHHACAHAVQEATLKEYKRLRRQLHLVRQLRREGSPHFPAGQVTTLSAEEEAARLPAYDFEYLADDSVAFKAAKCERITQNDWSSVDDEARKTVEVAYRKNARDANRLNGDVKAARASGVAGRAAIHRVISLHHPARLYSPPNQPCFALVATATMRKEACVGAYVGRVRTGEEYNKSTHPYDSVYAYKVDGFELDLVIDSLHAGNALRFMNDCFARQGGRLTANVSPRFLFDAVSHKPNCFILVSADKGVKKGEELVTDYGRQYWNRIVRALLRAHGRFGDQARLLIGALGRRIEGAGLPVPAEVEWSEVRRSEFSERWVEWPQFEGDEEASMDEWAQTEDDDNEQHSDSSDTQQQQQLPQQADDEHRAVDDRGSAAPAVKVRHGAESSSSGLQRARRHTTAATKRKRTEESRASTRLHRQKREKESQTVSVEEDEEEVMEAVHEQEEEQKQNKEEGVDPDVSADLAEMEPSMDGPVGPVVDMSATLSTSAGLREEIDLISDDEA